MSAAKHLPSGWFLQGRVKLRQLQVLVALDAHRKLHLAADSIGMSQPAASKLLSELETALSQPLFVRKGRGLEPNAFGQILTRRAQAILAELDGTRDELNALQDGHLGRVAIGAIDAAAIERVMPVVARAQALYPRIEIELQSGSSNALLERLNNNQLDLAFGRPMPELDHGTWLFRETGVEMLSLIGRPDHPLRQAGPLVPARLRDACWILQTRGTTLRRQVEDMFRRAGLALPERIVSTDSLLMTLAYVTGSDALSVVSERVALQQAACGQVAVLPLRPPLQAGAYGLILPANRAPSKAATTLIRLLEEPIAAAEFGRPDPVRHLVLHAAGEASSTA